MDLEDLLRLQNRFLIGFDLMLGTATLVAPHATLRALGHTEPAPETEALFRRCGPIWLTFAAAHIVAERRDTPADWWALAWLRGTEATTDTVWSLSPAFRRPGARPGLWFAGLYNIAVSAGFGWLATRRPAKRRFRLSR